MDTHPPNTSYNHDRTYMLTHKTCSTGKLASHDYCMWVGVYTQAHPNQVYITGYANHLRHTITPNAIKSPTPNTVRTMAMPSITFRHLEIFSVRRGKNVFYNARLLTVDCDKLPH